MFGLLYSPCSGGTETLADYGYEGEEVVLPARAGGNFRGYFIPGPNGATVIIPPTGSGGWDNQLPKAEMLLRHGYSVFVFESRRCANQGPLSLGYEEVEEVADVLDYLQARPEVDANRIGIWGFSTAGATAVMAGARLPVLRAVIAEGGYGNFLEAGLSPGKPEEGWFVYSFLTLYRWSSILTYRLITGTNISALNPSGMISQIAPRPILLIYGSNEVSLPGGYQQKAAAGDNAELWIIPGATHGNYRQVAGEEYEERVIEFLEAALNSR
jgi:pimeloyl-ACP methyl ester carboxylesterase